MPPATSLNELPVMHSRNFTMLDDLVEVEATAQKSMYNVVEKTNNQSIL